MHEAIDPEIKKGLALVIGICLILLGTRLKSVHNEAAPKVSNIFTGLGIALIALFALDQWCDVKVFR